MPKPAKYGKPDDENPEWTAERFQQAMRYPDLPPELMRLIEADRKKKANGQEAG